MINEKRGEESSSTLACLISCLYKFRKVSEKTLHQGIMPKVVTLQFSKQHKRSIGG
jgi:hypothetical protein